MQGSKWVGPLFIVAGLYDGVLGLAFLLFPMSVFQWYGVTPPNHVGYVQFPAALLIVFAIMFFRIAARPQANAILIPYGMLLKVSYVSIVVLHWIPGGLPQMWKPFAVIDVVFLIVFWWAYSSLKSTDKVQARPA